MLYFLSSLIVIQRPPGLYSDRTFQVANRKSFLSLLSYFFFFFFRNKCFSVDGPIAQPPDAGRSRTGGHPSGIQSYRCSQPLHWDQTLCVAALLEIKRYSGDQTLLIPSPVQPCLKISRIFPPSL
jgi:hypothetical protein